MKIKLLQGLKKENVDVRVQINSNFINSIKSESNSIRKWKRLNSFPLEFIYKNYPDFLEKVEYLKSGTGRSHTRAKIPSVFNKDLGYLLGAMRDGSLINVSNKHWVRLYDSLESRWLENINKIFQRIFDIDMHMRTQKKIKEKYLDISSKPVFYMLKILCDGELHKDVPKIIKKSSKNIKKSYIAGFFDAEGHVPSRKVKHKRYRITFTQKDIKSLNFIKQFLEDDGIKTSKISNYSFAIYGKEMIQKFNNNFILLNPEKKKRLNFMLRAL